MHLISIKNNKLIKRVAVASLAALMTIPNLATIPGDNTNIVYAATPMETYQKNIKHAQEMIDKFKKEGNEEGVKNWTKNLEKWIAASQTPVAKEAEQIVQNAMASAAQHEAQRQAEQAEKDRIANTVYPLTAKYVKDFVPAVDDYQPHFYERAELPGVIFTIQQDSFGKVFDCKPNIEIIELPDHYRETNANGNKELLYTDTCQVIKVNYTSPFNFAGKINIESFNTHPDLNKCELAVGWCLHIGKNRDVIMDRTIDIHYKSGWPESYIGKNVKEITQSNAIQPYGWFPDDSHLYRMTSEQIKKLRVTVNFSTDEGITRFKDTRKTINNYYGSTFDEYDSVYEVAKRYGTDYTDEERQTLVIKPTPFNPYTNAGSEPIVDEQEWIDANINYDRNPQSLSDEEWWK